MSGTKDYAVVRDGGRQYVVSVGDRVLLDRREGDPGAEIELGDVLAFRKGEEFRVGPGTKAKVVAEIRGELLGRKVLSYMYKRRKGQHRKKGHRQRYLEVRIKEIRIGS